MGGVMSCCYWHHALWTDRVWDLLRTQVFAADSRQAKAGLKEQVGAHFVRSAIPELSVHRGNRPGRAGGCVVLGTLPKK
jgi:hypothetical protein